MVKRIIASVILLPLLLAVLLIAPKIMTAILLCALCGFGAVELMYNTGLVRHIRLVVYGTVAAALVPLWCYFGMNHGLGLAGVLVLFGLLFMEMMLSHVKLRFEKVAICYAGAILIPYLLSALVRIIVWESGRHLILLPFVIAFLSDTGAYFVGMKFGKHKMAPVISPKKSVEGLFGGVATAIIGVLVYTMIMDLGFGFTANYGFAIIYGLIGSLAGVFGDLCFSVIKRQTGIKDYGDLIPGHGGVLDRFDSVIVVAPLVELLMLWIPLLVK